jgi:hypothetical protein
MLVLLRVPSGFSENFLVMNFGCADSMTVTLIAVDLNLWGAFIASPSFASRVSVSGCASLSRRPPDRTSPSGVS